MESANSCHVHALSFLMSSCQADTATRAMSRAVTTTCTSESGKASTTARACRGVETLSLSTDTSVPGQAAGAEMVDQCAPAAGDASVVGTAGATALKVPHGERLDRHSGSTGVLETLPPELVAVGPQNVLQEGRAGLVEPDVEVQRAGCHRPPFRRPAE
jgi:hypothetical protein